jgi:hypothetical protein
MAATYDLTTDVGKVRLLIADTDVSTDTSYDFSDEEIDVSIDMTINNFAASALLLRSLAANRARLSVSVKRGTMSEDLKQLATDLMEMARIYDEQSGADALETGGLEAIVEPSYEQFSYRRNIMKYGTS